MHLFLAPPALTTCQKCLKPARPHSVCRNCGYYKGREFINVFAELTKKEKKEREKEMQETEKSRKNE